MRKTVQGEGGGGGFANAYYRAYVNRYYSGVGCQNVGPAVAIGRGSSGKPHHSHVPAWACQWPYAILNGMIGAPTSSAPRRQEGLLRYSWTEHQMVGEEGRLHQT